MCFAVPQGQTQERADPFYHLPRHKWIVERLHTSGHPILSLGETEAVDAFVEGRVTPPSVDYSEDPTHPVFLRAQNIAAGYLDFEDAKRLEPDAFAAVQKAVVRDGDVVLTIDGVQLGKAAAYRDGMPPCCISNHMVRIVPGGRLSPEFLSAFLNSELGQDQIERGVTGSAIPGIRIGAISQIQAPAPDLEEQRKAVADLEAARALRQSKLAEADGLLAGLGGYLMDALGLVLPERELGAAYAVRVRDLSAEGRLDADYFDPERTRTLAALAAHANRLHPRRLDAVAAFVRDRQDADGGSRYLGLADIRSNTGELAPEPQDHPGTTCYTFQEGDVLYSRLRPNLNKVYRAEFGGVCSPEFHVVRVLPELGDHLLPDFLAAVLRSPLTLAQTRHMTTGNTHPRLSNEDVRKLAVPVPDLALQERAVAELRQRRARARQLRAEAAREWAEARATFEARLVGGPVQDE